MRRIIIANFGRRASKIFGRRAAAVSTLYPPFASQLTQHTRIFERSVSSALVNRSLNSNGFTKNTAFSVTKRNLFIQTDSTPNPNSLKFLPGKEVLPEEYGSSKDFKTFESTNVSPLARRLFRVEGVINVYLSNDYVSVTRDEDSLDWDGLKLDIFSAIMDHYACGDPVVTDEPPVSDTTIFDDDSEVRVMSCVVFFVYWSIH